MIWNIVEDCNDDNGKPTCWACKINSLIYGKYLWITKNSNGYDIEYNINDEFITIATTLYLCDAFNQAESLIEE